MTQEERNKLREFCLNYGDELAQAARDFDAARAHKLRAEFKSWRAELLTPQGAFGELEQAWEKLEYTHCYHAQGAHTKSSQAELTQNPWKLELIIAAADHGVSLQDVSYYRQEDTARLIELVFEGKASCNSFMNEHALRSWVIDCGLSRELSPPQIPRKLEFISCAQRRITHDMSVSAAMSADECLALMDHAMDFVAARKQAGSTGIILGEFGIGNTCSLSLISQLLCGGELAASSRSFSPSFLQHKRSVLQCALARNPEISLEELGARTYDAPSILELVCEYGGFELAWLCAAVLAAYRYNMSVILDSALTVLAAALAHEIIQNAPQRPAYSLSDSLIATHQSSELAAQALYQRLGITPLLNWSGSAGESCAALIAYSSIMSLDRCFRYMHQWGNFGICPRCDS